MIPYDHAADQNVQRVVDERARARGLGPDMGVQPRQYGGLRRTGGYRIYYGRTWEEAEVNRDRGERAKQRALIARVEGAVEP